jgi:hypothetical protein
MIPDPFLHKVPREILATEVLAGGLPWVFEDRAPLQAVAVAPAKMDPLHRVLHAVEAREQVHHFLVK